MDNTQISISISIYNMYFLSIKDKKIHVPVLVIFHVHSHFLSKKKSLTMES